jgi:hypothetical protein
VEADQDNDRRMMGLKSLRHHSRSVQKIMNRSMRC